MNKIYHPCNLLCPSSSTHHQSRGKCGRTSYNKIQIYRPHFYSHLKVQHNISWTFHSHHHFARHSINGSDSTVHGESDSQRYSAETKGSVERKDGQQERLLSTTKILEQLKRYGISGVLSYGLLNTIYYLTTFLLVWFYFAPAPGKMGYLAAVSRFLQVMAMVWAGSQVTKLIRAAGALALAPLVDRGLSWFTVRYKFESRGKAFFTIFAICISLAVIVFLVVTLLWA